MKKINLSFVLLLLVFSFLSCSNDDNDTVVSSKTIKNIEEKIYYNGQIDSQYIINFNYNYNYNGAVLESVSDDQNKLKFIYNGDKIIETKLYVSNQHLSSNFITYENDLLKMIIQDDQEEQTSFTYNNGVLNSKSNSYMDNGTMVTYSTETYQFLSNNIVQKITESQFSTTPTKRTFEFDSKNSMFKNMNSYLKYIFNFETIDGLSKNNPIKAYDYPTINSTEGILTGEFAITYDNDEYPVLIKKYNVSNNQQQLISELIISYN